MMIQRVLSSLRTRMLLLVVLTLLPAFGLTLFLSAKHETAEVHNAEERAFALTRSISEQHDDLIQETRQVLVALSRLPAVRHQDSVSCAALFSELIRSYPAYTTIWASRPDGTVICASAPVPAGVSNAGDSYLERAVRTGAFSVGEYRIGRVSGRPVLQLGQPVFEDGRVVAVVAAALDLEWLSHSLARTLMPEGTNVTVIDRNGVMLARYPDDGIPIGTSTAGTELTDEMLARGQGVTRARGLDGVDRLYGFSRLGPEMAGVFVRAGIPASAAMAHSTESRRIALIGMAFATALSMIVAWFASDALVVRRYRQIVAVTDRIRAGDLTARLRFRLGGGEVNQIASSINGMAEELERRQEELTAERDFASRVLQNMGQGLTLTDAEGRFTFVNEAFAQMLGYKPGELISVRPRDLTVSEDQKALAATLEERRQGLTTTYTTRLRRRDGGEVFAMITGVPSGGEGVSSIAVVTDLTEHRRREEELRANKEHLDRIIDTIADGLLIIDAHGTFTLANPAAAHILGVAPEEIARGLPIESVPWKRYTLDGQPLEMDELPFAKVRRMGRPVADVEFLVEHPDGTRIAVSVNAAPLHDAGGGFAGVVASLSDITGIKAAEIALRASEERFRTLVQNGSDLITILDREGQIRYSSPAVERLLGYHAADVVGTSVSELIHPEDVARAALMFRERLGVHGVGLPEVYRLRHKDGSWRHIETIGTNLLHNASVRGIVLNSHDITERTYLEEKLARQAHYDALTGLPNRMLFVERSQQILDGRGRRTGADAVLFLDLDGFKRVNDTLGHGAGDTLLIAAARRLADSVRPEDLVSRFGGDEFVILLHGAGDGGTAAVIAERILAAMCAPIEIDGHEVSVSVSIGIALDPGRETRIENLLRDADVALYRAKAAGKGRVVIFEPEMNDHALERLELAAALRHSIERGELTPVYQPQVDLSTGAVVAMEALVRWNQPGRGEIEPAEFIPLAEESGLMPTLGQWLLDAACRQAVAWDAGLGLVVSVNLSMQQLRHPGLASLIQAVLDETGLPAGRLQLEISTNGAMQDTPATALVLAELKALGVRLAADHFGAGYSSFGDLGRLRPDVLKVDMAFVEELNGGRAQAVAVLQAIVDFAHQLGTRVAVTDVDSADALETALAAGCDYAQGLHFSPPLQCKAALHRAGPSPSLPST